MASSTLSLCSSLSVQCKISHKLRTPVVSNNPNLPFLSLPSSHKLSLSSNRLAFPLPPRAAATESEAPPVLEAEVETPKLEEDAAPAVEASPEEPPPKREEIFAVVMIGSRQYIVFPGRFIYTQRLKGANINDKIVLKKVLLVGTKNSTYIGKPVVTNAAVHAVVEEQGLDKKVIVFKYKKKKNYRRNIGHRQPITRIKITGITGYQDYPAVTLDEAAV
ncbi:50S ribosomal protein L21, chloroplastic [Morus notabilis]|uniref:50S ribosomal protein L21, chloroplastic n=1 Tax=Morus notabilis TaxID=981085 RepID=UPI000CED255E|nr:50S ribosomal protein L21, chloroplastic [Morus notabilis]